MWTCRGGPSWTRGRGRAAGPERSGEGWGGEGRGQADLKGECRTPNPVLRLSLTPSTGAPSITLPSHHPSRAVPLTSPHQASHPPYPPGGTGPPAR
eukprot:scaffold3652_cov106-Isochrysis_galbana.AAC.1